MTKKEVVILERPYVPLIQKPMCCAVTCLQMILYRNGFGLYDQEDLAIEFGVKIDKKYAPAFREDMPIMTSNNLDEGIATIESEAIINTFFERLKVPLSATAFRCSEISNLEKFILDNLSAQRDLWVEYHAHEIHSDDTTKGHYIHDGLIESYQLASQTAVVIDPVPEHRQRLRVGIVELEASISDKFGRETGIIIVQRSEEKV